MKKLSRIAALLAAGALLFGAVGCSDSDDDGGVGVTATVGSKIELEEGKGGTYVVTFSVTGDTFSDGTQSLGVNAPIPDGYLKLTAGDKVTISEVKVSEKFTDTVGKVSIKVTAAVGATDGTITAELLKGTLKNTTDTVTATPISYTIKGDKSEGDEPVTYDFRELTSADVSALGITATEGSDKDTGKIAKSDNEYGLSNGAFLYSKGDGNLKIRFATKNNIASPISLNFGGQSIGDKDTTATPGDIGTTESGSASRYIALPVSASKFNVAVTYKSTNEKKVQIVVVDENGKILAKDEPNGENSEKTYTTGTLEKGSASKIRIYLYRIDDNSSGGADVSKIVVTPVSE